MASVAPRLTISANARAGVGGQGRNLTQVVAGLGAAFELAVWSRDLWPGLDGGSIPLAASARLLGAVPVLRRRRDWLVWLDDTRFDRRVATRLARTDLFHGATGQCLDSLRVARSRGAPVVLDAITMHVDDFGAAMDRECARMGVRPVLHRRLRARMRREYQEADLIRVMSDSSRRTFLARGIPDGRVVAVPPALDPAEFPAAQAPTDTFRISYVGLLEPWKGFHYLLEAFATLRVKRADLVLWGAPGARPIARYLRMKTAADPRITLRTFDPARDGYGVPYVNASVLVHPSLSDGFGQVVAEAMACGIPVIATDRTGAAEWIEEGRNGFVVPAGDAGAIRDRLEFLASHPAAVAELGRRGRETVRALSVAEFRRRYVPRLRALLP